MESERWWTEKLAARVYARRSNLRVPARTVNTLDTTTTIPMAPKIRFSGVGHFCKEPKGDEQARSGNLLH
jgi:putative hemolysin